MSLHRKYYCYARICGALAHAHLGARASTLARSGRLVDLWTRIFPEEPVRLPETLLVAAAELRIRSDSLRSFLRIVGSTAAKTEFFRALLRKPEYEYLKLLLSALREGRARPPDPGFFPHAPDFRLERYPEPSGMFGRGRFAWIADEGFPDLAAARNRLDCQYYTELWASLATVSPGYRGSLPELVADDIEIENLLWALRLRRYYALPTEDITRRLVRIRGPDLQSVAQSALKLRMDQRGDWDGWRWESCLNPAGGGSESWLLDCLHFEKSLLRQRYRDLKRSLHLEPFTFAPLYCFFRIGEYETAALFGIVEGLRFGAETAEIAEYVLGLTEASA
ncbi:MAG TPA: V-type ATPase subunit [Rectinemataceae bacterium]|nr:V-type ATPase subunit [Rectinemataceae bacterium]